MNDPIHFPPTLIDLGQFLDGFWPEAAATVVGAGLGIPLALAIDRQLERRRRATAAARERQRVVSAARLLHREVTANLAALEVLRAALAANQVTVRAWASADGFEIVRADVAELIDDVDVRARLAHWFGEIRRAQWLSDLLYQTTLTPRPMRIASPGTPDPVDVNAQNLAESARTAIERVMEAAARVLSDLDGLADWPPSAPAATAVEGASEPRSAH